jgi:hypothetical protein
MTVACSHGTRAPLWPPTRPPAGADSVGVSRLCLRSRGSVSPRVARVVYPNPPSPRTLRADRTAIPSWSAPAGLIQISSIFACTRVPRGAPSWSWRLLQPLEVPRSHCRSAHLPVCHLPATNPKARGSNPLGRASEGAGTSRGFSSGVPALFFTESTVVSKSSANDSTEQGRGRRGCTAPRSRAQHSGLLRALLATHSRCSRSDAVHGIAQVVH